MSNTRSFVETTLPPGYAIFTHTMNDYGEECDPYVTCVFGVECYWYRVFDEICDEMHRTAWRHWTATVLRGRDVEWDREGRVIGRAVALGAANAMHENGRIFVSVRGTDTYGGDTDVCIAATGDLDEAMARFAWLVGAAEGMVPR